MLLTIEFENTAIENPVFEWTKQRSFNKGKELHAQKYIFRNNSGCRPASANVAQHLRMQGMIGEFVAAFSNADHQVRLMPRVWNLVFTFGNGVQNPDLKLVKSL